MSKLRSKNIYCTFLCILLGVSSHILAQDNSQGFFYQGWIKDSANLNPIAFATIQLYSGKKAKSTLLAFAFSSEEGKYQLEIPKDLESNNLWLKVSHLSYNEEHKPFDGHNDSIILMSKNSIFIEDVIISERRQRFVNRGDTIDFDMVAIRDSSEYLLKELLSKVPGIKIAESGKISFNGKTVDRMLVNGNDIFGRDYYHIPNQLRAKYINDVKLINKYSSDPVKQWINPSDELAIDLSIASTSKPNGSISIGVGKEREYLHDGDLNAFFIKKNLQHVATATSTSSHQTSNLLIADNTLQVEDVLSLPEALQIELPLDQEPLSTDHTINYNLFYRSKGHVLSVSTKYGAGNSNQYVERTSQSNQDQLTFKRQSELQDANRHNHGTAYLKHEYVSLRNKRLSLHNSLRFSRKSRDLDKTLQTNFSSPNIQSFEQTELSSDSKNEMFDWISSAYLILGDKSLLNLQIGMQQKNETAIIDGSHLMYLDSLLLEDDRWLPNAMSAHSRWYCNLNYQNKINHKASLDIDIGGKVANFELTDPSKNSIIHEEYKQLSLPVAINFRYRLGSNWQFRMRNKFTLVSYTNVNGSLVENNRNYSFLMNFRYEPKPSKSLKITLSSANQTPNIKEIARLVQVIDFFKIRKPLSNWSSGLEHGLAMHYTTINSLSGVTFNMLASYQYNPKHLGVNFGLVDELESTDLVRLNSAHQTIMSLGFSKYFNRSKINFSQSIQLLIGQSPFQINHKSQTIKSISTYWETNVSKKISKPITFVLQSSIVHNSNSLTNITSWNIEEEFNIRLKLKKTKIFVQYGLSTWTANNDTKNVSQSLEGGCSIPVQSKKRASFIHFRLHYPLNNQYNILETREIILQNIQYDTANIFGLLSFDFSF